MTLQIEVQPVTSMSAGTRSCLSRLTDKKKRATVKETLCHFRVTQARLSAQATQVPVWTTCACLAVLETESVVTEGVSAAQDTQVYTARITHATLTVEHAMDLVKTSASLALLVLLQK